MNEIFNVENPDKYFSSSLNKYSNTLNTAIKVSMLAANRQASDRVVWACVLYTKLCVTGKSLYILSPMNKLLKKESHWDFSSLFTLARNIVECYQTFFYLCIDNVNADEYKARKKLFDLHDFYSRKKFFSYFPESNFSKEVSIEEQLIKDLEETEYFSSINEKQQKHFLKGDNAFFINREEIEDRIGNDINSFKMLYKLFSSNTHSFPMGFYRMLEGERCTGVKSTVETGYCGLAIETSEIYIRRAANDMLVIFPDILHKLKTHEKEYIRL